MQNVENVPVCSVPFFRVELLWPGTRCDPVGCGRRCGVGLSPFSELEKRGEFTEADPFSRLAWREGWGGRGKRDVVVGKGL